MTFLQLFSSRGPASGWRRWLLLLLGLGGHLAQAQTAGGLDYSQLKLPVLAGLSTTPKLLVRLRNSDAATGAVDERS